MMRVSDVLDAIDAVAPFAAAEPWDRVGLALGDPTDTVTGIHVALDPTLEAIVAAVGLGANVLVTHHPLMLEAPAALVAGDPCADRVLAASRAGMSIIAAHTNADVVSGFATAEVVAALGIAGPHPLLPATGLRLFKLVVFVPNAAVEEVAEALAEAGAGTIGNYAECTFRAPGIGAFRPLVGATPSIGSVGELERVDETRLETVVTAGRLAGALLAMIEAHPYEEVAYDVYPLEGSSGGGFGCVGALEAPASIAEITDRCARYYGATPWLPAGRAASPRPRDSIIDSAAHEASNARAENTVSRVAVMPGSASAAAGAAADAHADVLVCGEMKYHEALDAAEKGVTVLAVGHGASEMPIVRGLAQALRDAVAARGWAVPVTIARGPGEEAG